MSTLIHERVAAAQARTNPTVVGRMASGWVVLGDSQFLRGYSLLLPDPVVDSLNRLRGPARAQYLLDMVSIGDALLELTDSWRINYSILGNTDAALHAHIHCRYWSEPPEFRGGPAFAYKEQLASVPFELNRDRHLMRELYAKLDAAGVVSEPGPAIVDGA
jgi:diadenosine tetraphosphate (Ap4A) HIT family hydrolase